MVTQVATDIERMVLRWLEKQKINYQFQVSLMGGYLSQGGAVVDVILPERRIAIRIFGQYWHRGVVPEARDVIQRENLMALGWTVVDLWGQDIKERLSQTMRLALQGREML